MPTLSKSTFIECPLVAIAGHWAYWSCWSSSGLGVNDMSGPLRRTESSFNDLSRMQAEKKVARVELGPRSTLMLDRFSAPNMTSFVGFSALLPPGEGGPAARRLCPGADNVGQPRRLSRRGGLSAPDGDWRVEGADVEEGEPLLEMLGDGGTRRGMARGILDLH